MKIRARFTETGTLVDLLDDGEWVRAHPGGRNPRLFCAVAGCNVRLFAAERRNKARGTITRFFAFGPKSPRCAHEADGEGVEVPDPAAIIVTPQGHGGGGPITDEHQWLVNFVVSAAQRGGFEPVTEQRLAGGVVADVFVPGAARARVEVQRVDTDVTDRTQRYEDVVWLWRNPPDDKYLFDYPAVKILCSRWLKGSDGEGNWVPAEPWGKDQNYRCWIKAATTVFTPLKVPKGRTYFETKPILLSQFLQEVWSGQRRWYPRGEVHTFAGWVLNEDYEKYERWYDAQQKLQHAVITQPPARPTPVKVSPPQTQPAAVPSAEPTLVPAAASPPAIKPAHPQAEPHRSARAPQPISPAPQPLPHAVEASPNGPPGPPTADEVAEFIGKFIEEYPVQVLATLIGVLAVIGTIVCYIQA
ncbi:hypothetical protein [Mycobacteroides abscessus]|uniref:hypothetical protein n=1 Tax=Mycobacteroides abscessus TaxID=36809 RepID=UPI000C266D61|nr:hypothetical protein [Mycobacteroides abscessus]RIS83614.1 hypothetical protein D2E44_10705 [Mycobacteroides abscessus]